MSSGPCTGRLAGGSLGGVAQHAGVGKDCEHARHRSDVLGAEVAEPAVRHRSADEDAVGETVGQHLGGVGRTTGDLEPALGAVERLTEHALHHVVEAVALIGRVHPKMRGHRTSPPVASASTAASVRRAKGSLKSFAAATLGLAKQDVGGAIEEGGGRRFADERRLDFRVAPGRGGYTAEGQRGAGDAPALHPHHSRH